MSTPFYDLASLVVVPSGYKASKVYAQKPLTTDGQLTFSRASTATRVNSAGLIETVSSNVPRLDYLGSTCPKLQLEPQRSNIILYSSDYTVGAWTKNAGATVTANTVTSPDGTTNATTLTVSTSFYSGLYQGISGSTAAHTVSIFAKKGTKNWLYLFDATATGQAWFNLNTGTLGTVQAGRTATIENYGNGWYRCSITRTAGNAIAYMQLGLSDSDGESQPTSTGTAYLWGAQVEAGAYPTSLIQTTNAAVTRLADACSKTGISSLIGQTEGTLFVDTSETFYQSGTNDIWLMQTAVNDTTAAILIYYTPASGLTAFINNGTASVSMQAPFTLNQRNKVAVAYKNGEYALALNGSIVDTDSSAIAPPSGMNQVAFVKWVGTATSQKESVNQALLFKTRLTNAQLAELTAL